MQELDILDGGRSAGGFRLGMPGPAKQKASLVFVDPSAKDVSALISAAEQGDLVFLSTVQDGLEQIARHLCGRGRLSRIHVLADFSLGRLALGNKVLVVRSLRDYTAALARIGRAVRGGGEIVIGAGGVRDGQGENFRRIFEACASVPVRHWDGSARRRV